MGKCILFVLLVVVSAFIIGCTTFHRTGHYEPLIKDGKPVLDKKGRIVQYKVYEEFQEIKGGGKSNIEKKSMDRKSPWTIPDFPKLELKD